MTYRERVAMVSAALADPTRRQIMELLLDAGMPLSAREVAETFGLHVNAARTHLEKLVKGGLLAVTRRRGERGGRPAHVYVVSDEDWELHLPPRSYRPLAAILASGLRQCGTDVMTSLVEEARAYGRSEGARNASPLAQLARGAKVDAVAEAWKEDLVRRGVSARLGGREDGSVEVTFLSCPFGGVVDVCRELVCGIHRGMEEGLLGLAGDWHIEHVGEGCVFVARRRGRGRRAG